MENRLKEMRVKSNLSQEELSRKAGIARTTISGLESGRVKIVTTETLEKLASALGTKITDIFF